MFVVPNASNNTTRSAPLNGSRQRFAATICGNLAEALGPITPSFVRLLPLFPAATSRGPQQKSGSRCQKSLVKENLSGFVMLLEPSLSTVGSKLTQSNIGSRSDSRTSMPAGKGIVRHESGSREDEPRQTPFQPEHTNRQRYQGTGAGPRSRGRAPPPNAHWPPPRSRPKHPCTSWRF